MTKLFFNWSRKRIVRLGVAACRLAADWLLAYIGGESAVGWGHHVPVQCSVWSVERCPLYIGAPVTSLCHHTITHTLDYIEVLDEFDTVSCAS